MKKIKWFFSSWQRFVPFVFLLVVLIGMLTQWNDFKTIPLWQACIPFLIVLGALAILLTWLIKDWRKWGSARAAATVYTIPKGEHYSSHPFSFYSGSKKNFVITALFDESCRYDLNSVDQFDINKLWGVSFGDHQKNSIRIGWNYDAQKDEIILSVYTYENGQRKYRQVSTCRINQLFLLSLTLNKSSYTVSEGLGSIEIPYKYPWLKAGYYLYPYFGGNQPAPHDVHIQLTF
jgi:hypothetical protein